MPTLTFDNICDWLEIFDFEINYRYKRRGKNVIVYKHESGLEVEVKE